MRAHFTHPYLFLCLMLQSHPLFQVKTHTNAHVFFQRKTLFRNTSLSHIVFFYVVFFFHLILVDVYSFMYRHLLVTVCMFYLNRKKTEEKYNDKVRYKKTDFKFM